MPFETSGPTDERPFLILAVCTGNICRSPALERRLAAELGPLGGVVVASAGTHAVVGHGVSAPMVPLLTAAGASADGFVARQLTEPIVAGANLVLAMTREHRSAVVQASPAAVRRAFTLKELVRLASAVDPAALPAGTPAQRLAALIPLAAAQRGRQQVTREQDDVVDPYRRGDAVYAEVFAQLDAAARTIATVARG